MAIAKTARIHPTAVIDPQAELADGVQVGPLAIIEGPVRVGPGCHIKGGAHLIGPMTMGQDNVVHSRAVLGDTPQHLRYNGEPTSLEIGDGNIFRENVTIHRAVVPGAATRIGDRNFFMACSHIGHDCVVGNNCVMANGAIVGGHAVLENNVTLSGNSAIHQFCRIGRLAMLSGVSATSMDIPPFLTYQRINTVCGVNVVGMRRAGISPAAIEAVRHAFHILYREHNILSVSLQQLEREMNHIPEIQEMIVFIRNSKRGVTLHAERNAA